MIINACIIVKDDSECAQLDRAIDSIAEHVDGIYITATGEKTDKIKELCEFSRFKKLHYSYYKWDDNFANARNFNFSQVPKNTDYIFWMDTDDVLVGADLLRDVAQTAKETRKDIVFFTYWYGCNFNEKGELTEVLMEHMRERLIRPGVITWKGRLHETPVPNEGTKHIYTSYKYDDKERPIAIMHTSLNEDLPAKMARNKRLLELQLQDEREKGEADPRTLLYLMKIYAEENIVEQWPVVIEMGKEYLRKSGWDEERGTCYEMMGLVYGKMGKLKESAKCFHEGIYEWPHQVLLYIRLASAFYNLKNYKACEHWLETASKMDMDKRFTSGMFNIKAIKVLYAELLLKLNYNIHKNTQKALEAANLLYREDPKPEHKETLLFLQDAHDLNEACKNTDKLTHYLADIGESKKIVPLLDTLPDAITTQPFAIKTRQMFTPARKWGRNEICYFANFGSKHFEKWDASSLDKGIGGSETAVIELAEEWTKLGYSVTIYGDPSNRDPKDLRQFRIKYLPWYYFNKNDYFNIFIQWRGWQLAGKVKARKFYVDLHDIYSTVDISEEQTRNIDKIFVKSDYHRRLGQNLPDEKFQVVSNGIRI